MATDKIAIFPGSFDPFTNGHWDIVKRGLRLFDKVYIAIGYNSQKKRYFDIDFTMSKINDLIADVDGAEVLHYNELTAGLAKKLNANYLLRGLRNTTDFEFENGISQVNRKINAELETVFLIMSPQFAAISSSIIREVHKFGGDVKEFLPYEL